MATTMTAKTETTYEQLARLGLLHKLPSWVRGYRWEDEELRRLSRAGTKAMIEEAKPG